MVGSTRVLTSIFIVFIFTVAGIKPVRADEGLGHRNIRLRTRTPGVYLAPLENASNPEGHNFTTTEQPIAPLEIDELERVLGTHPDLKDYRVVLIGPAISGDQAEKYKTFTEKVLRDAGVDPQVQVIRHPHGIVEHATNLVPRKEDYEAPLPSELKVAAFKIVLAEGLSFIALLVPPFLKGTAMDPTWTAVIDKIALPLDVAIPMVVLDIAHMVPLISYRRALSNHNIRLSPTERFGRQFLMGMFFSFNFYMTSQWHHFGAALTDVGAMLSVIVPASLFNMLSRTTVGTSLNIWEQRGTNRRFWTTVLEAVTGLAIAPLYIFSTMPVLDPLVHTPLMNLNAAHLGLLGIGVAGGGSWLALERKAVGHFIKETVPTCARRIANAVAGLWRAQDPT